MLTRFLNSAFAANAIGAAAITTGVFAVACFVIGLANVLQWIARVF